MKIQLSEHFTYKKLLRFVLPSIIVMIFTSIYKTALAAINLTLPIIMGLSALGFMIGTGGSAIVARMLGEKKREKANEYFSMLIYVTAIGGILLSILGAIFIPAIASLLGAKGQLLSNCILYARLSFISMPAFMLQNVFQSFLVVAERPQLGLLITIASGLTNMILDAYFIAILRLGVVGAAAATALSQSIGGLIPLLYFIFPNRSRLRLGKAHMDFSALLKACTNGASEFMTNISMSIVNMLYNWQLMRLSGSDGVAVYGVIMYVSFIFAALFIGYSMGSAPIVGYHCGAGNKSELKNLLGKSFRLILTFQIILTIAAEAGAPFLAGIFVRYNTNLLDMTVHAFRSYSISFLFMGFSIYASSFFTALNDGFVSAAISFCRTMIFETGAVIILPFFLGVSGIWYSIIAAEFMAVCLSLFFLIRKAKKYGYA